MSRQNGEQPTRRLTVAELLAQHGKADLGSSAGRRRRRRAADDQEESAESELTTTAPHEIIARIRSEQDVDFKPRERNGHSLGELDTETEVARPETPKKTPAPEPAQDAVDSATTRTDIKPAGPKDGSSSDDVPSLRQPGPGNRTGRGFAPVPPPGDKTGTGFAPAQPPGERTGKGFPPAPGKRPGQGFPPAPPGERTGKGFAPAPPPGERTGAAFSPAPGERIRKDFPPAPGPKSGTGFAPVPPGERTGKGFAPAPPPGERNGSPVGEKSASGFAPVTPPGSIDDRLNGADAPAPPRPGQPPQQGHGGQPPFPPPPRRPMQQAEATEQFQAVDEDEDDALADDDYAYGDELDYVEDEELDDYVDDDYDDYDDYDDGYAEDDYAEDDYVDDGAYEDYDDADEQADDFAAVEDEEPELLSGRQEDVDEVADEDEESEDSPAKQWLIVGVQLALGVVGGAAVWLLFNWLWNQLPVVALATALVVTAGLVWIVRKIRKAEDMQTTLLAVLVGLVVTVSPAMLLLLSR